MKVNYKREEPSVKEPVLGSEFAGAYDVFADEIIDLKDGRVWVKLNLVVEVPEGYRLMLQPRSSITKSTFQLQNSVGIIDADFREGIQARFITAPTGLVHDYAQGMMFLHYPKFPHHVGERIGQVYLEKIIPIEWNEVQELSATKRDGGFGSTGK